MKSSSLIPSCALEPLVQRGEDGFVSPDNISTIVGLAPDAYTKNVASNEACRKAGHALLQRVAEEGMSDTLDMEIASYLKKTKATLKVMNDRRTPATQIMDEIRSRYTALERELDATKPDTIPSYLQQARNGYAAQKRAEEEDRRREALRRQREIEDLNKYRQDLEMAYKRAVNDLINENIKKLFALNRGITRANADETLETLRTWDLYLGTEWVVSTGNDVPVPAGLGPNLTDPMPREVWISIKSSCEQQYTYEVSTNRDQILYIVKSKADALKAIPAGDSEREAQILQQSAADDLLIEQTNAARKVDADRGIRRAEETQSKAAQLVDLFSQAAIAAPAYTPNTTVKKRIKALAPEAFLQIISFWWAEQGCTLSIEELSSLFKKQVTFCEKKANQAKPVFINHASILYEDEVKAR